MKNTSFPTKIGAQLRGSDNPNDRQAHNAQSNADEIAKLEEKIDQLEARIAALEAK